MYRRMHNNRYRNNNVFTTRNFTIFCVGFFIFVLWYSRSTPVDRKQINERDKSNEHSLSRQIDILLWNHMEGWWDPFGDMAVCPLPCNLITDKSKQNTASAVVYLVTLDPMNQSPPLDKPPGQKWVAYSLESPQNAAIFKDKELLSNVDYFMTEDRHAELPAFFCTGSLEDYQNLKNKPIPHKDDSLAPVSYFASNCAYTPNNRSQVVEELMKHIQVDSYGACLHNKDIPGINGETRWRSDLYELKQQTVSKYKFYLAFENSNSPDYVTEKIYHAYLAGAIPVYLGAPNIEDWVPYPDSYIDVNKFSSVKELASYLNKVANDRNLFESYFAWRYNNQPLNPHFKKRYQFCHLQAFCRLCGKLMDEKIKESKIVLEYPK